MTPSTEMNSVTVRVPMVVSFLGGWYVHPSWFVPTVVLRAERG
jgi:hypothetical protein